MTLIPDENILYCDNHLLCVDKPAGMLTQADRTGDLDLLTWAGRYLQDRFGKPGPAFVGLVHRLDRPASGVIVLARTSKAAARLSQQFRDREVTKKYLAVVEGVVDVAGVLRDRVRKVGTGSIVVDGDPEGGRLAELSWILVSSVNNRSLVAITLVTGRKHQIRVQLARAGHPIVGDRRYGATSEHDGRNIALHCYYLALQHPTLGKPIHWTAVPPVSWGRARNDAAFFVSGPFSNQ